MRYSAIDKDEAAAKIRRDKALEAEQQAFADEFELKATERLAALNGAFPHSKAFERIIPARKKAAEGARAKATLRALKADLGEGEQKQAQADFLTRYVDWLEREHLATSIEIEELSTEDEDADTQALKYRLVDLDTRHALAKELLAPLRGNRKQRRAAKK